MSIFDSIRNAIFRRSPATSQPTRPTPPPTARAGAQSAAPSAAPPRPTPATAAPAAAAPAVEPVDVEAVLEGLAAKQPQKLNWRESIVDLMKLLDLDSSLSNRKSLAKELGYTGDTGDSAAMNMWLHKQVMKKLEESGGKVPVSLRD